MGKTYEFFKLFTYKLSLFAKLFSLLCFTFSSHVYAQNFLIPPKKNLDPFLSSVNFEALQAEFAQEVQMSDEHYRLFFFYIDGYNDSFFDKAAIGTVNASNIDNYLAETKKLFYTRYQTFLEKKDELAIQYNQQKSVNARLEVANGPCTNMGFEDGTFNGWQGSVQKRSSTTVSNGFLHHCVMSQGMTDPYVPALSVIPSGKTHSVRLGNAARGGHMAKIRQTFKVDSSNMIFTYRYAVVLEDPYDERNSKSHAGLNSPHFEANLITQGGDTLSCAQYAVVVSANLASYSRVCVDASNNDSQNNIGCPAGANGSDGSKSPTIKSSTNLGPTDLCGDMDIYYRDWSTVTIVLDKYLGQNVTIEFSAADCVPGGHLGYAYVYAECNKLNLALPGFICSNKETKTVSAPPGFASYAWSASNGGHIQGGTNSQFITITSAGTYKVIVSPISTAATTCPYEITYLVQNRCPLEKTLCATGNGTTADVNLTIYNDEVRANVTTSQVQSWHSGLPASNTNKIPDPTLASISSGKYYAVLLDPSVKNDTVMVTFNIIPNPKANFTDLPTFCLGSAIYTIKGATPSGGIFSGPHVSSDGKFDPSAIGNYNIKYKVVNLNGCSDSIIKPAVVKTIAPIIASGDTTICFSGQTSDLLLKSSASLGDSVVWSSAVGTIEDKNAPSTYIHLNEPVPFERQFYAIVHSYNTTCPPSKDSVLVVVKQLPSMTLPDDISICTDGGTESIPLQAQVQYQENILWEGNDATFTNSTGTSTNVSLNTVYPQVKSFTLRLNASKKYCPVVKDSLTVQLNPIPSVDTQIDTAYCISESSFPIQGSSQGADSVHWIVKNFTGAILDPNKASTSFQLSNTPPSGMSGKFILSAISKKCGIVADSFFVKLLPGPKVNAVTQPTCSSDRKVLLKGWASLNGVTTSGFWKSAGSGTFENPIDSLNNAYIPSAQDLAKDNVQLTLTSLGQVSCPSSDTTFICTIGQLPKLTVPLPTPCEDDQITLVANKINGAKYAWGNASESSQNSTTLNVGKGLHQYKVRVKDAMGCKDSLYLDLIPYPAPVFTLQGSQVCPGQSGTIAASLSIPSQSSDPTFKFQWKKGDQSVSSPTWEKLVYSQAGNYSLELSFHGCSKTRSVTVISNPEPDIQMPTEHKYCIETDSLIKLTSPSFDKYFWHFENGTIETNPSITVRPAQNTRYKLVVANKYGCKDSVTITVKSACPPRLFVPNVITPQSNDGNSALQIFGANYTNFEITVFNRWGEVIFNTRDPKNAWDGMYKLENMPIGTYPWIVTYEGNSEEYKGPYKKVGEVTIIR